MLVYLYYLIKIPAEFGRCFQIVLGFLLGFIIDVFCNTPGMHALTCTFTMWVRIPILHLFTQSKQELKIGAPGIDTLNQSIFFRFCTTLILLHCIVLYLVEAYTLFDFFPMLCKVLITFAFTMALVSVLEISTTKK